ncbi:MAG TPA: sensor histidine kinase [Acidimicrobiia bacterium]|nr:sensor histidine kinase [Acidimicrobiia bacterium]
MLVERLRDAWRRTDPLTAALVAVVVVLFAFTPEPEAGADRPFDLGGLALLAGTVVLLPLGRRFPATVALAALATSAVWHTAGYSSSLINLATFAAFFLLGMAGDRRRQMAVAALAGAVTAVAVLADSGQPWSEVVDAVGWTIVAILLGVLVRARRRVLDTYAERAARAEAERDAEAERRVAEERIRIARELHDLLAHTVSVMTVQAGVAADSLHRRPDVARTAIDTIRSAGRDAMAEIRATVAVLRSGAAPSGGHGMAPAPGLARIDELVTSAGAAGLTVEVHALPPAVALPPVVELTAYRVVQEALTNVIRHAGATRAEVSLALTADALVIDVHDDGSASGGVSVSAGAGATAGGSGFGLRGMAERVESLGGSLQYGRRPGGGFIVRATVPVGQASG